MNRVRRRKPISVECVFGTPEGVPFQNEEGRC